MKHQVEQVETLNKYAEYIHALFCYEESFTLTQVKAPTSQSSNRDYNRSVKTSLVSLANKDSSKGKGRINKITSCEVLKKKSSIEEKTDVNRTPGNSRKSSHKNDTLHQVLVLS